MAPSALTCTVLHTYISVNSQMQIGHTVYCRISCNYRYHPAWMKPESTLEAKPCQWKLLHPHKSMTALRKSSLFFFFFFTTKVVCTEGDYGWAVVQPGALQWEEAREHRQGSRDINAICNTSHGRWTYHKAPREVAITHNVACAMFPVLSAGQTAQRPGSWTEAAWLGVMKLPGSQVHPPFCIAVSEQSRCQTQWEKLERMLKMLLGDPVFWRRFEILCDFLSLWWR